MGEVTAEDDLAGVLRALGVERDEDRVVVGEPSRELLDVGVARAGRRELALRAYWVLDVAEQLRLVAVGRGEPQRVGLAGPVRRHALRGDREPDGAVVGL